MNAAVIAAALALGAAAPQRDTGRIAAPACPQATTPGAPQCPELTRHAAIDSALAHNPQIEAARQQVAQARARRVEATAIPDPSLSGSLDTENSLFGASPQKSLGFGFTVPFPDRIRLRGKVAGADVRSAELNVTLLQQQIGSQTAQAYDALLVALQHERDLLDQRQLVQDVLKKTQARFNAGTAAKLDVVRAQVTHPRPDRRWVCRRCALPSFAVEGVPALRLARSALRVAVVRS